MATSDSNSSSNSNSVCPECNGRLRETDTETVCEECGLVTTEDAVDHGPEWRSFDDEDTDRRRTGAPLTESFNECFVTVLFLGLMGFT